MKYRMFLGAFLLAFVALAAAPAHAAAASTCSFTRTFWVGVVNDEVKCIQQYLNANGYTVAASGAGSSGNETTYFGPATAAAVAKWQVANGILPHSGYFGSLSIAKYKELVGITLPMSTLLPASGTLAPTAGLTAAATTSGTVLTLVTTNVSSCTSAIGTTIGDGSWTKLLGQGPYAIYTKTVSPSAITDYSVTCQNSAGTSVTSNTATSISTTDNASSSGPNPSPTVVLTASTTTVPSGGSSILTLTLTNVYTCTSATGTTVGDNSWTLIGGIEGVNAVYAKTVSPTATTNYSVTCRNQAGDSIKSKTVTISVSTSTAPTATISASPTSITSGGSSTLTLATTNASSCPSGSAYGGWTLSSGTAGGTATYTKTVSPTATTAYSITCQNSAGTSVTSNSVTVSVSAATVAAPTATISASPTSVGVNGISNISWSCTNSSSATLNTPFATGVAVATTGSANTVPLPSAGNYTWTINCAGSNGGAASKSVTVTAGSVSFLDRATNVAAAIWSWTW
ncbi:MAG: peptidoglycan-binding protein [Candidatus Niyogibacteria bacterium]|nr:peptidoglycan-binding protein [Candidatus Niyogibacteria bacterium]